MLSVVSDFTSKSTHYMARPDNLLNLYFVKFSWGWTLLFTSAFVFVTCRCVRLSRHGGHNATCPNDISVLNYTAFSTIDVAFI